MPESKSVGILTADIKATKADDGSYDITLSVPIEDRDGEVIDPKAFEPLPAGRMPIDVDHGMTVLSTVGSGLPEYDGDVLKLRDFRFATTTLAADVKTLVDEGHVSKMSVAFMAAERDSDEKDGRVHIRKAELLNAAIVAIPSNREADIVLMAKSALQKLGARNSSKDMESIQGIHDHAASLGAACANEARSVPAMLTPGEFVASRSALLKNPGLLSVNDARELENTKSTTCIACGHTPADTDPEETAATAAVEPLADVDVAKALAELTLTEAELALE